MFEVVANFVSLRELAQMSEGSSQSLGNQLPMSLVTSEGERLVGPCGLESPLSGRPVIAGPICGLAAQQVEKDLLLQSLGRKETVVEQ